MGRKINDDELIRMFEEGIPQKDIAAHFGCSPPAVCQRLKRLIPPEVPESLEALTPKQQSFALQVAGGKSQTAAAMDAFDCTSRDSAKAMGYQMMKREEIQHR